MAMSGRSSKLRYLSGCSIEEAAELLEMSRATTHRHWSFARAWRSSQLGSIREWLRARDWPLILRDGISCTIRRTA